MRECRSNEGKSEQQTKSRSEKLARMELNPGRGLKINSRQQNFSFLLRCFLLSENNGVENSKFCLTGKSAVQHDRFIFNVIPNSFRDLTDRKLKYQADKMLPFVRTGSHKIFKILKQVQDDKNFE